MKPLRDDDDAVSPVIGVILMVAITVILAAVIGTFVLNLGGSVQENVQAGASVSATSDHAVKVTFTSNQNAEYLDVTVGDGNAGNVTSLANVGDTWTSSTANAGDQVSVIITAIGSGESKTVIVNKEVKV